MRRYFEFALVVTLLGGISLQLLRSLDSTRLAVEEAVVQSEAAAIRIGLLEVVTHREAFGGAWPASDNPLAWVAAPPVNYAGEFDAAPSGQAIWYFDRTARELVYRFRDGHLARFRLSRNAGASQGRAVLAGIGLQRLPDRPE